VDFYRQRVLIPIRDERSRMCGFLGRNVGGDRWPKYKNPPRTHAYDKSVNLYQPLPAPTAPGGQVVVVEGTLDAMAIAVAAVRSGRSGQFCPVTQSGRELSVVQLERVISLHRPSLVLAFDGDSAGRDSAHRYAVPAARLGHSAAVTSLRPVLPTQAVACGSQFQRGLIWPLPSHPTESSPTHHFSRRITGWHCDCPRGSSPERDPPTDDQLLVTPEEAARRLSVGRTTIYELMSTGELQSVNIGRCRRVPVSSLASFVSGLLGDCVTE